MTEREPPPADEHRRRQTLEAIGVCLDDGARIVDLGRERLDRDWLVRRAAKNVIAELGEAVGRLPDWFVRDRPGVPWRAISGMRNRTVHAYQHTDYDVIWDTLEISFPDLRRALDPSA